MEVDDSRADDYGHFEKNNFTNEELTKDNHLGIATTEQQKLQDKMFQKYDGGMDYKRAVNIEREERKFDAEKGNRYDTERSAKIDKAFSFFDDPLSEVTKETWEATKPKGSALDKFGMPMIFGTAGEDYNGDIEKMTIGQVNEMIDEIPVSKAMTGNVTNVLNDNDAEFLASTQKLGKLIEENKK